LGIGQFESQKAITSKELSPGDLLYFFLFYRQARPEKEVMAVLLRLPLFQQNPLVQLAYPTDFQEYPEDIISDWEPWMRGQYAMILDALQGYLSEEWLKAEKAKSSIHSWENMKRLGSVYEKLFDGYLKAVESSGRWDLARFLLRMLNSLFQYQSLSLEFWIEQLRDQDVPTKLSDRLLVHRQAIVVPRVLERMRQWTERARAVAFFEEDYSKAQWWLREWEEHNGPRLVEYVRRLTQEAEPLRLGSGATREKPA
jgi:hypothetical protein